MRRLTWPISFWDSDRKIYKTLLSSPTRSIGSQTLLDAEYGKNFLRKFGVSPPLSGSVEVRNIFQDKETPFALRIFLSLVASAYVRGKAKYARDDEVQGQAVDKKDRAIFVNRVLWNPAHQGLVLLLGQSIVSTLAAAAAGGAATLLAWFWARKILTASLLSSLRQAMVSRFLTFPFRPLSNTLGHEHVHVLQKHDPDKDKTGIFDNRTRNAMEEHIKGVFRFISATDRIASFWTLRYLMGDCEVQARLHTIMVQGSKRWGTLPHNREELWLALEDSGLAMPGGIRDELRQKLKGDFKVAAAFAAPTAASRFNRVARMVYFPEIAEIQAAQRALHTSELKTLFWREALPYYYGHLLHLYGKEDGLEMMGFDSKKPAHQNMPGIYKNHKLNADEIFAELERTGFIRRDENGRFVPGNGLSP